MTFPGGRFYPFQLRAAKAELLHLTGRWKELTVLLEQDMNRSQEYQVLSYQGRCLLKLGIIDAQRGNFTGSGEKIAKAFERYKLAGDGPKCPNSKADGLSAIGWQADRTRRDR